MKFFVATITDVTIKYQKLKNAAEILDVNKGDILAFYEEEGRVYIEKG